MIEQKGMTSNHDFGYSFPLFSSLLKKQKRRMNNKNFKYCLSARSFDMCIYQFMRALKLTDLGTFLQSYIKLKMLLYIRKLRLTPVFRQHNIHLVFSTCQHKYKWILCTEKPVSNASFQDFWSANINNHLICFEKNNKFLFKG